MLTALPVGEDITQQADVLQWGSRARAHIAYS